MKQPSLKAKKESTAYDIGFSKTPDKYRSRITGLKAKKQASINAVTSVNKLHATGSK